MINITLTRDEDDSVVINYWDEDNTRRGVINEQNENYEKVLEIMDLIWDVTEER